MKKPRKLQPGEVANFETLRAAFANGDCCLIRGRELATGKEVGLICAGIKQPDGGCEFVPLAVQFTGNPYEDYSIDDDQGTGEGAATRPGRDRGSDQSG